MTSSYRCNDIQFEYKLHDLHPRKKPYIAMHLVLHQNVLHVLELLKYLMYVVHVLELLRLLDTLFDWQSASNRSNSSKHSLPSTIGSSSHTRL